MTSFSAKIDLASKFPVGDMSVVRWLATCNRRCSGVPLDFCCCPLPGCWSHCRRCICTCAQSDERTYPELQRFAECKLLVLAFELGATGALKLPPLSNFLCASVLADSSLEPLLSSRCPKHCGVQSAWRRANPLSRQLPGRSRSSSARDASVRPINCQVHLIGQAQAACFFNLHRARRPQADWLSHPSAPTPTRFWSCRLPA